MDNGTALAETLNAHQKTHSTLAHTHFGLTQPAAAGEILSARLATAKTHHKFDVISVRHCDLVSMCDFGVISVRFRAQGEPARRGCAVAEHAGDQEDPQPLSIGHEAGLGQVSLQSGYGPEWEDSTTEIELCDVRGWEHNGFFPEMTGDGEGEKVCVVEKCSSFVSFEFAYYW